MPQPEQGSVSTFIAAPPERVYELVADVTRIGEWSPECVRAEWHEDATEAAAGARFQGYNQIGEFKWDVPCVVLEAERGKTFSFAGPVDSETRSVWTYTFEAEGGGTRVTESFNTPLINVEGAAPNFPGRYEMLVSSCEQTLASLKAYAEKG